MTEAPTIWWTHARVHTGDAVLEDHGVATRDGRVVQVSPSAAPPERVDETVDLDGAVLAPGLVDLQVNGGGGATFTESPTREDLDTIAAAHRSAGTTAFLATTISAPLETTLAALEHLAPPLPEGCVGWHLEGPALDPTRAGAHDAAVLRALDGREVEGLGRVAARAAARVTLSASHATRELVQRLVGAGVVVSLGHTDASAAEARAAFDAGVRGVTHLYNAMSGLAGREPGVVGAALADDRVHCGVIADGVHVDATSIAVAWRAKPRGHLHLVSDAIALAGHDQDETLLGGRRVRREGGRCVNDDGTLAGSDSRLIDGVRFCVREVGIPLAEALRMASGYPAAHQGLKDRGRIEPGARAELVALTDDLEVARVITP